MMLKWILMILMMERVNYVKDNNNDDNYDNNYDINTRTL